MTEMSQVVPDVVAPPEIQCCRNGHPQTPDNVYLHKQSQRYYCRVCRRLREQGRLVGHPRETVWNDETIAELRRLNDLRHTASWIALEFKHTFGIDITRCSVLGKLHRLGLSNPMPLKRERKARGPRKPSAWKPTPRPAPEPVPIVADDLIPFEQRRTIDQLENDTCRWPLPGDPVEFYCGKIEADLAGGRPYCFHHFGRAYQASAPRRSFIPMRSERV